MKTNFIKALGLGVRKRAPALFLGFGITGMFTTTILAVRATPKALSLLEERQAEQEDDLTAIEKVETAWKCYIPAAITAGLSVACLIESHKIHGRRNAALATVYSLSESAIREYQEKVIETIGPKKEKDIRDQIDNDRIHKTPVAKREVIITGKGDTLCHDVTSGRYFKGDIDQLRKVRNELNHQMMSDMSISLNEFYIAVGLNEIAIGDDIGWNVNRGLIELSFSSQLTEDGVPCLVISHANRPTYGYQYT